MATILVCDDETGDRTEAETEFQRAQARAGAIDIEWIDVHSCDLNIPAIREAIKFNNPSVILVDMCNMQRDSGGKAEPQWVGPDLVRQIHEQHPEIPLVVWTNIAREPYKQATDAIRNGAIDIVFKPDLQIDVEDTSRTSPLDHDEQTTRINDAYDDMLIRVTSILGKIKSEEKYKQDRALAEKKFSIIYSIVVGIINVILAIIAGIVEKSTSVGILVGISTFILSAVVLIRELRKDKIIQKYFLTVNETGDRSSP